MKVKFYYIDTEKEMSPTFRCIKYKGVLYPIDPMWSDSKKAFIPGHGYKKITDRNVVEVPRFSLQSEDWDGYIREYGHRALFFSLTDVQYGSQDCCHYHIHMEFNAVLSVDIKRYIKWLDLVYELQGAQLPYLQKYEKEVSFPYTFIQEHQIIPYYTISAGGLTVPFQPTLDPIRDEKKLDSLYWKLELNKDDKDGFNHTEEILKRMGDSKEWPASIKDRMTKMYGHEVSELYGKILNFNLIDEKEKKIA